MSAYVLYYIILALVMPGPSQGSPCPAGGCDEPVVAALRSFLLSPAAGPPADIAQADPAEVERLMDRALPYLSSPVPEATGKVPILDTYYLYDLPDGYDPARPWPLIISLHGNPPGHCEKVHYNYWRGIPARRGYILVSPNLDRGYWQRSKGDPVLLAALRDAVTRFHVDRSRIYLNGYSSGGHGVWTLGTRYAHLFAGFVIRCGYWDVSNRLMKNLRGRGVVVIHAKEDDKVEVERARLAVDVLKMYRIRHVYWEFDGGHDFFPSANNDVLDYLAKHANPTRQAVDFYLDGTAAPTLVHFVSASGQGHLVKTAAEPGRLAVTVSTPGKVKHLDVFFSEDLVDFGTPVAIEVNGTPLTVTPAKSLNAFVTAWTLHPFYDPAEKDRLFLGGCRVMEDGKILEQPRPL